MEKKTILRILLTAATLLLLGMLAWQCLDIYLVGNSSANLDESGLYIQSVYRAEDVIARLSGLRIWAIGYLALLIAVSVFLFGNTGKEKNLAMEPDNRLRLMKKKLAELPDTAKKEEQFRQRVWYAACGMAALCAGISLLYLLNRENFTSWDLETVMGSMLVHILPWILLAFAGFIAASCLCRRSMEREIQLLRGLTGSPAPAAKETPSRVNTVRIALYALAAILIVLGIQNGGMRDVLIKAINICTECIGLG